MTTNTNALDLFNSLAGLGANKIAEDLNELKSDTAVAVGSYLSENDSDKDALRRLKEFVENPNGGTQAAKAIGGGSTAVSVEQEAVQALIDSNKLTVGQKKALEKLLLSNELKVDDEGTPLATSAATSQVQKDLEKKNNEMTNAFSEIGSKFEGVALTGSNYNKFAQDIVKKRDDQVKEAADKATAKASEHFKDIRSVDDVKAWATAFETHVATGKKKRFGSDYVFSEGDFNSLHRDVEGFKHFANGTSPSN
jgi:hypothetical protein